MKVLFGKRTMVNGSPVLIRDWLIKRINEGLLTFPKDVAFVEGEHLFIPPTACTEESLTTFANELVKYQRTYIENQLTGHKAGRMMGVIYRVVDSGTNEKEGRIRVVERTVAPGLCYEKMKHANPKGMGLQSKKLEWDNSFQIHVSSTGEDRSVFINKYDSDTVHTPEHLVGTMLRLPVTYGKDGHPTKPKTTYYKLDGTKMTEEEIKATDSTSSSTGYIDTVFSIYIDKILSISNKKAA